MSKPLALIVEDDPDIGNIFSITLGMADFQTKLISFGDEAVAWLATEVPNIIILDMRLPFVSGVEILRQIRANPQLAKTFVIVTTAHLESAAFLHEQADLVLVKPIDINQLRDLATQLHSQS